MTRFNKGGVFKRIGCGLALCSAFIASSPLPALACTQITVGEKLTSNGSRYVGRAEDYGSRYLKLFGIEPAHEAGFTYISDESGFTYTTSTPTYRYTWVRDHPSQWDDCTDAYSEAGINEKGVSCSATLTTGYNSEAKAADPLDWDTGIGEYSYASVVLGESDSARAGVELLGKLIDEKGTCGNDQILISDASESWIFATLSGHQWIAFKVPADKASVNPNIGNLTYDVDLDDTASCLHSAAIESMPREKGFLKTNADGSMNIAETYGETIQGSGSSQWTRYFQGRTYFGAAGVEGTDYTLGNKGAMASSLQPLFFTPARSDYSTFDLIRSFAARGEQTTDLNANTNSSLYAIGNNRTVESNLFEIRSGLSSDIATVQWEMLAQAEFSVAVPTYSALITELSPYYSTMDVSFDHCEEDALTEEEPENSLNYVLMDINTLCYNNRASAAEGMRAYLDALQKEIIEQQSTVDTYMQKVSSDKRTEVANAAELSVVKNTYTKCKTALDELRAYLKAGDTSSPFVPSDYNSANKRLKSSITYASDVVPEEKPSEPTTPTTPTEPTTPSGPTTPTTPTDPTTPTTPTTPTETATEPGASTSIDVTTTTVKADGKKEVKSTATKGTMPATGDGISSFQLVAVMAMGVVFASIGLMAIRKKSR